MHEVISSMLLDFVTINFKFEYDEKNLTGKAKRAVFMVNCNKTYKQCFLVVCPEALALYSEDRKQLVDGLIHEMSHIHITPLADVAECRHTTSKEIEEAVEETTEVMAEYMRRYFRIINKNIYN